MILSFLRYNSRSLNNQSLHSYHESQTHFMKLWVTYRTFKQVKLKELAVQDDLQDDAAQEVKHVLGDQEVSELHPHEFYHACQRHSPNQIYITIIYINTYTHILNKLRYYLHK